MPYNRVSEEPPSWCHRCEKDVTPEHWFWQKGDRYRLGGTWRCIEVKRDANVRYNQRVKGDPVRYRKKIRWQDERYADEYNRLYIRWKAYHCVDRQLGRMSIERDVALPIMRKDCYYCGKENAGGLDRIDNTLGHMETNVRPCCMVCNGVLSDLPDKVKQLLAPGLRQAREQGAFGDWLPPQLRGAIAKQQNRIQQRKESEQDQ